MELLPSDWTVILLPETPLFGLMVRGGLLYFGILLLIRFMPRRSVSGEMATMDLIFALLIVEAATHSMGVYTSVGDGLTLIVILMGWNYLINTLSYRFKFVEQLVRPHHYRLSGMAGF